jgi:hypothetical protein
MHQGTAAQLALCLGRFFGQDMTHIGVAGLETTTPGFPETLRGAPVGFELWHDT